VKTKNKQTRAKQEQWQVPMEAKINNSTHCGIAASIRQLKNLFNLMANLIFFFNCFRICGAYR